MKLISIFKSLVFIYIFLGLMIFAFQRLLIFQPTPSIEHPFNVYRLNNNGHEIQAIRTNQNSANAIIYFGGNAEQVAFTAYDFAEAFPNHTTYLLQYRGYGGTPGKPSESALYSDAMKLFDEVIKSQPESITIIGRSLGSGIASYLASQRSIDKLVLVTPFDSVAQVAKNMLPIFPVTWMIKDQFDSKSRANQIEADNLVIVATEDKVITWSHTENLVQSLPAKTTSLVKIKAGHNDLDSFPEYYKSMSRFIR